MSSFLHFEHRSQPLLPRREFLGRLARYSFFATLLLGGSLGIGVFGYHYLNDLNWVDSLLNASMILAGMGPTNPLINNTAKVFASLYAIFSGIIFLTTVAVFLSPVFHRILHKLHLEDDSR
jgi:hypothetical protein